MKRSRIICSIITVIYTILSVALCLVLLKSNVTTESSISMVTKAIYIGVFVVCTLMYIWVRNRLSRKMSNKDLSIKISRMYCYLYLGIIVLVTRFVMAYILKENVVNVVAPSFSAGLGSYINYGLGMLIGNQMYANVIINTILAFLSCIIIKRIVLNITDNDMVATTTSIVYLLAPQSLVYVTEYVKYSYNVLLVLVGIYVFLHIIDEVKNFNKKNKKYLIYSVIFGVVQAIDVILGGSYILWLATVIIIMAVATYVDVSHITIKFKKKLNYKLKILAERVEKINISKLVYVSVVSLVISGITTLIYAKLSSTNNFQMFSVSNLVNVLMHSRNYYLVLIICALVFEIIAIVTRRKIDAKMYIIKVAFMSAASLTFYTVDGIYASAVFDVLLILNTVMNICNICYNREERIKLLRDKN